MAASYFLPYTEGDSMDGRLLSAIRTQNKERLQDLLRGTGTTTEQPRNQFGETVVHLVCRYCDDNVDMLRFVVEGRDLPLNVRDCHGRTPLHNVCMAVRPNMDKVRYIVTRHPELLLYEDFSGRVPLELVRPEYHERCLQVLKDSTSSWVVELLTRKQFEYSATSKE
jgi:hypothetical protein